MRIRNVGVRTLAGLICLSLPLLHDAQAAAKSADQLKGPVSARVERVIDGDTLIVRAKIWLGQELTVRVRLAGIDAPEMRGRRDPLQRNAGWQAYKALYRIAHGHQITLRNIRRGKYAGRVIAELYLRDGTNVSEHLLDGGFAIPYGKKYRTNYSPFDEIRDRRNFQR